MNVLAFYLQHTWSTFTVQLIKLIRPITQWFWPQEYFLWENKAKLICARINTQTASISKRPPPRYDRGVTSLLLTLRDRIRSFTQADRQTDRHTHTHTDVHLIGLFFHCHLETLQHLGHIASRIFGCIPEGCVFLLLCVVNVSIVKITELTLWYMNLMNNGQMDRGNENPTQHLPLMIEENHENTSARLVGTGIWTRDLPNASLVRYHGATSLGIFNPL